jgi:hypothetical protein
MKSATVCRGIEPVSQARSPAVLRTSDGINLVTGFEPVLLDRGSGWQSAPRSVQPDHQLLLGLRMPTAMVRSVSLFTSTFAWANINPDPAAFDSNSDSVLGSHELVIDTKPKKDAVRSARCAGLNDPASSMVEPYSINHDVTLGSWSCAPGLPLSDSP